MTMRQRELITFLVGITLIVLSYFVVVGTEAYAQSTEIDRLKNEITDRNSRLLEIEQEIAQYQIDLQKVGSEKSTLQNAINQLELERDKVQADISYTQNKIGATDLEISKLNIEITNTELTVIQNKNAIEEILRRVNQADQDSFIELLLRNENLSEFWGSVEELEQIRSAMSDEVRNLVSQKILLEAKRINSTEKREELIDLKDKYSNQNKLLSNNKNSKSQLLRVTKNEEANFQALLSQKRAAREQIFKELRDFGSQLQFILNPDTIPPPGTPVFNWPLKNYIITQYFGGTEFAKRNAAIYAGRPYHPGIDLAVPRGTEILAPLPGVVRATGNTDAIPGCSSWGKWALIDHANGLSTLYAHQDLVNVSVGQRVNTGDVIGYSGNTGYSTGPHLHFAVYAKAGVEVRKFSDIKTITSCGPAYTPVAATDAYIDPMLYLP